LAAIPTDLPLLSLQELVQVFDAWAALSRHSCLNTGNHK